MRALAGLGSQPGKLRRLLANISQGWQRQRDRLHDAIRPQREVRGIKLLCEWLSPDQLKQFNQDRHFEVTGCQTGKRYRIRYGTATNIHELDDDGKSIAVWCFVPVGALVAGDVMLAQKIALETDEQNALQVAQRFKPTRG